MKNKHPGHVDPTDSLSDDILKWSIQLHMSIAGPLESSGKIHVLGQETYEDGNTTVDRKCICNTDRGYSFVKKPKTKCYCDPLIEDCSCYLVKNPYNKTNDLTDIKCYNDMKMTRIPYLREMFNSSRTIKIIEFDSFKYNLNYPTINIMVKKSRLNKSKKTKTSQNSPQYKICPKPPPAKMHHSSSPGSSKKQSCTLQKSITPKRIRTLSPMKHSPASFSANDNTTSSNPEDDDTTIVNEKTTTCTQIYNETG
ncbi:unnamed protein product [Mytilus edulis]|uniref:Uncharacterized protein n=1 Tax=Mytilus edulis TaxID=6550 RepID=A0A8S3SV19_MYTED|nr:unnamed protein product [Mytilus edulis]